MVGTIQEYTLDMADGTAQKSLIVKQGDTNSRQARFKLTAFKEPWTIPFGAQIHINVHKNDGTYANATCIMEDEHTVLAPITEQMTAVTGTQLGELYFLGSDGDIRSQTFPLVVWDTVTDLDLMASANDFQALKDALRDVKASTETAEIATQYATEQGNAARNAAQRAENAADSIQEAVDAAAQAETAKTAAETARTGAETAKADTQALKTQIEATVSTATKQVNDAGATQVQAVADEGVERLDAITDYVESQKAAFVGYSKRETDSQYANAIIKTATGAGRVDVDDAWTSPVIGMDVAGRSEQVVTTGAQLLDWSKATFSDCVPVKEGTIRCNINNKYYCCVATTELNDYILSRKGEPITLSCIGNPAGRYIGITIYGTYEDGKTVKEIGVNGNNVTFTIPNDILTATKTELRVSRISPAITDTTTIISDIMLNAGDTPLPYEPYTGAAASPSPAYPQQIVSTGTVGTGAQLLDFDAWKNVPIIEGTAIWKDGKVTLTATKDDCYTGFASSTAHKIPVKPNTKYTLSWESDNVSGMVHIFHNGGVAGNVNTSSATKKLTIITNSDDDYITFRFGVQKAGTTKSYWNIMLNAGDTAKPWEPYTGGKPAPTAEYPQEMTVRARGKNLLEDRLYRAGYSGGVANIVSFSDIVLPYKPIRESGGVGRITPCKKGETYTFSITNPNLNCALALGEYENVEAAIDAKNKISWVLTGNPKPITYTAKSDGILLCVVAGVWTDGHTTIHECTESELLQCEVGTTATPYEPYRTAAATITLTEPLRGIGEYRDRLGYRDGVWGIEGRYREDIFDGSDDEPWVEYEKKGNVALFCIAINDCLNGFQTSKCNRYSNVNGVWADTHDGRYGVYSDHNDNLYKYFRFPNAEVTTLAQWRAWLAANPLTLVYQLATPTWTPLPDAAQQTLNALTTFAGTTHLTITTGGTTPDVTLDYVQDTHKALEEHDAAAKEYTDNQIAEILVLLPTATQAAIINNGASALLAESEVQV